MTKSNYVYEFIITLEAPKNCNQTRWLNEIVKVLSNSVAKWFYKKTKQQEMKIHGKFNVKEIAGRVNN